MVWENGNCLAESERFPAGVRRSVADVDLELLRAERMRMGTFDDNRVHHGISVDEYRRVPFRLDPPPGDIGLRRKIERFPFVPSNAARLEQDCYEAYNIQVSGLEQRLRAIGSPKVVIGVSGGLDSTHALIVAARAMDRLGRPRSDILAFTLPGFATGDRTKSNAVRLGESARGHVLGDRHPQDRRVDADRDRPPVRPWGEGLRRHVRERAGRPAHRLSVPAGQPARRHRAGHR